MRARILRVVGLVTACLATLSPITCCGRDLIITDLWDQPLGLKDVCKGRETLLLVCDPATVDCREGAVYLDSRTAWIRAQGAEPACLFIGSPPEIRDVALALDLGMPIYIGSRQDVLGGLIGQKVLPAILVLGPDGSVARTVYGGGESLDNNLRIVLRAEERGTRIKPVLLLVSLALIAALVVLAL
jgi:hypothetical protein